MPLYTEKQRKAVLARAGEAVQARIGGATEVTLGTGAAKQTFDLDAGGYCNRFVRQVFETSLGLSPFTWYFGAAKACQTLAKLKPYEVPLKDRQPGDILGFAGDPGHICLYLGTDFDPSKELVAENTSARRGFPAAPGDEGDPLRQPQRG
ncbi:MAG: hypothetical protein WCP21_20060 [Armatimonadota bacterium]